MARTARAALTRAAHSFDDPDLGPLVDTFLCDLPDQIEQLRGYGVSDVALAEAALRLESALDSYGLDDLVPGARRIAEVATAGADYKVITAAVDNLATLCKEMDDR